MGHVLWRTPRWSGEACSTDLSPGSVWSEAVDWTVKGLLASSPVTNKQGQFEQWARIKLWTEQSHCGRGWNIFWCIEIDMLESSRASCNWYKRKPWRIKENWCKEWFPLSSCNHSYCARNLRVCCVVYLLNPLGCYFVRENVTKPGTKCFSAWMLMY